VNVLFLFITMNVDLFHTLTLSCCFQGLRAFMLLHGRDKAEDGELSEMMLLFLLCYV
jgi:hypothetical protein